LDSNINEILREKQINNSFLKSINVAVFYNN